MGLRELGLALAAVAVGVAAYATCAPRATDVPGPAPAISGDAPTPGARPRAADASASADAATKPADAEAAAAARRHVLDGRLHTFDGRALAGAIVRAAPVPVFPSAPDARKPVETTADASGNFALRNLDAGDWALRVSAEGAIRSYVATVRVPERERFDLVLPRGVVIDGTLIDETTHATIAGARVRLVSWHGVVGDARTGADGRFSMSLFNYLGSNPRFVVDADGYTKAPAESSGLAIDDGALGRHEVTIVAQHGHTLTGHVVGPDGPVAGATVRLWGGDAHRETTTDAAGGYAFDHLDAAEFGVFATADGLVQEQNSDPGIVEPDEEQGKSVKPAESGWTAPDITMRCRVPLGRCRIEGVVCVELGKPVGGALVHTLQGASSVRATSGDDGTYVLAGVPADGEQGVKVVAEREGYEKSDPYWREAKPGSTETDAVMLIQPLAHARGRVTGSGGAPVADAHVVVVTSNVNTFDDEVPADEKETHAAEGRTAADGTFDVMFHSLRRDFALVVEAPGFARQVVEKSEDESADARTEIALVAPLAVAGRVVRAGTEIGVAGLDVAMVRGGESVFGFERAPFYPRVVAVTAADGSFRAEGLVPGVEALRVRGAGWLDAEVPADRLAAGNVRVEIDAALVITGRAQFADGAPCGDVPVSAVEQVPEEKLNDEAHPVDPQVQHVRAAADGSFSFGGLRSGKYTLGFSGGTPQVIVCDGGTFDAGTREVRVELVRGATIRGRVTGPDGAPQKDVKVVAKPDGREGPYGGSTTDSAGAFVLGGLDEGAYVVTVASKGCFTWTKPGARAADAPLDVRLDAGLAVAGVVLDPDGKPKWALRLLVEPVEGQLPAEPQRCETDGDGRFRVSALTRGRWRIRVDPEWPFDKLADLVVEAGSVSLELRVLPRETTGDGK